MLRAPRLGAVALALLALPPGPAPSDEPKFTSFVEAGEPDTCLDVLFVAEGYSKGAGERKYKKDVERYAKRLLATRPFCWYEKQINVRGAFLPSKDDGCDESSEAHEVDTVLDSCFNNKDGRSLCFRDEAALASLLHAAGPVQIAFVMVNTERYGGAGTVVSTVLVGGRPLPAPTFAAQDTSSFRIALHELGHSFADLSDEYEEAAKHSSYPLPDEGDVPTANATLPTAFDRTSDETLAATLKWGHFLKLKGAGNHEWLHEGGFYREKGVFRPWPVCFMRSLDDEFCPVCTEEISKAIVAACAGQWDDAAYHDAHPLGEWRERR